MSGSWGPGSLAFFYETNKREADDSASDWFRKAEENIDPNEPVDSVYTGQDDQFNIFQSSVDYEVEQEAHNWLASYSLDLGIWSLGLAVAPEYQDTTYSLTDWLPGVVTRPEDADFAGALHLINTEYLRYKADRQKDAGRQPDIFR